MLRSGRGSPSCTDRLHVVEEMVLRLRKKKYKLQLEDAGKESLRQKIAELETVIAGGNGKFVEYEHGLVWKLIERITVHDDHFTVEFKSGIGIEVRL